VIPKNIVNSKYDKESTSGKKSDGNMNNIKTKKAKPENNKSKEASNANKIFISMELRKFLCTILQTYEDSDPEFSELNTEEESDDDEFWVDEWLSTEDESTIEEKISSNLASSTQSMDDSVCSYVDCILGYKVLSYDNSTIGLLNHLREELNLLPLKQLCSCG
jgi:hypothetical protein